MSAVAAALDGEVAGDVRRWCESCERLVVVCAAADPEPVLAHFAALPQIVAVIEQDGRRAVGVTVEGVPVELFAVEPGSIRHRALRATGSPLYVAGLGPLPQAPDEESVYGLLGLPSVPPELRGSRFAARRPAPRARSTSAATSIATRPPPTGEAPSRDGARRSARGYEYLAICDHTRPWASSPASTPDDAARQAEEIAEATSGSRHSVILRGDRVRHPALTAGLDLPDDVLAELDWVQLSVHGGQRAPRRELTARVEHGDHAPGCAAASAIPPGD